MTAREAYTVLKKMHPRAKTEQNKRAIEYAMVLIAQKVGEDELNK